MAHEEPIGSAAAKPGYRVQKVAVVVEGSDVQVREFTVAPGEGTPWHYHSELTDWCYCLDGELSADRLDPATGRAVEARLARGQSCKIPAGTIHRLVNKSGAICRYLLVQGVGRYDFVRVDDPHPR